MFLKIVFFTKQALFNYLNINKLHFNFQFSFNWQTNDKNFVKDVRVMHLDSPGTRRVPVVVYCCTPKSVVIFRKHCTLIYIDHKHPTRETVGLPAHVCSLRKRTQWLPFLCPLISTPWASYLSDLLVLVQREKSRTVGKHVIVTEIKLLYMHHK